MPDFFTPQQERKGGRPADPKRQEAQDRGEATYVPTNPCLHGHSLRYANTGNCIECAANRQRAKQQLRRAERSKLSPKSPTARLNRHDRKIETCLNSIINIENVLTAMNTFTLARVSALEEHAGVQPDLEDAARMRALFDKHTMTGLLERTTEAAQELTKMREQVAAALKEIAQQNTAAIQTIAQRLDALEARNPDTPNTAN